MFDPIPHGPLFWDSANLPEPFFLPLKLERVGNLHANLSVVLMLVIQQVNCWEDGINILAEVKP